MTTPLLIDIPGGLATELFLGGRGRPLLAVHGTPSLAASMRPFLDVADGRPRAAVDLPGHGRTPRIALEGDALLDEIARRVLRTLDGLGWSSCIGVGHSGGCAILYRAALLDPGRFSSFLFAGPIGEVAEGKAGRRQNAALYPPEHFIEAIDVVVEFLYSVEARPRVRPQWLEWARRVDSRASSTLLRAWGECSDVLEQLAELHIPTTVLMSTADRSVPEAEVESVARALSARVIRVPGEHFLFAESPVEAAAAVREFLATA